MSTETRTPYWTCAQLDAWYDRIIDKAEVWGWDAPAVRREIVALQHVEARQGAV